MKNIQGVKIGNVVNVSIDGKLHKKNCGSPNEANELFKLVLKAKDNPTDDNIKYIRMFLNEKTRVAMMAGLEADPETGDVYLAGFNTPIPITLVEVIKEYHENNFPLDAVINFWKLLMINPDKRVRVSLFDFITSHDFVLTDKGYMVVYKAVYYKENDKKSMPKTALDEFITNQYFHVKKDWKCSPHKYVVYLDNFQYAITKTETADGWDLTTKKIIGNLGDLYNKLVTAEVSDDIFGDGTVYTDMHTRTMSIQLGVPVKMDRTKCDSDPAVDCSYGLHVGATKYVERFANNASAILACLVNPAHVVAVPEYDHSKMRVAEYFPFAFATFKDKKIDVVEQAYFEDDYCEYELAQVEELIDKVQAEELPIKTALNAEDEERPMMELLKLLESRLIDIDVDLE